MTSTNCELKCDWATHEAAKYACEHWHYSKCLPAGKSFKIGAWEDGQYIGVVIFSRGANNHIGTPYNLQQTECVELTRIALREHQHFVSEIMMAALRKLKEMNPGLRLIVSYADPMHGHVGAIYQATNWIYVGPAKIQNHWMINGRLVHKKTINALKPKGITQSEFVYAHYRNALSVPVPGKHTYLMPLDRKMKKQLLPLAKPYPKKPNADEAGDGSSQSTAAVQH